MKQAFAVPDYESTGTLPMHDHKAEVEKRFSESGRGFLEPKPGCDRILFILKGELADMYQISLMETFVVLLMLIIYSLPVVFSIWILITVRRIERRLELRFAEIQQLLQNKG